MGSNTAPASADDKTEKEASAVRAWRVRQLASLGLARPVAEAVADTVDWHDVAKLVQRGCPAALAVTILQ
jgi:hypothetical protein